MAVNTDTLHNALNALFRRNVDVRTIEYRSSEARRGYGSRSDWLPGQWDSEPDKRQWMTAAKLPGLVVRGPMGALCGYVGVSTFHPAYRAEYDNVPVCVHGGLTFSGLCAESGDIASRICHVVEGREEHVWWLGFDCAHAWDTVPGMHALASYAFAHVDAHLWEGEDTTYRDFEWVAEQVELLAAQLKALTWRSWLASRLRTNAERLGWRIHSVVRDAVQWAQDDLAQLKGVKKQESTWDTPEFRNASERLTRLRKSVRRDSGAWWWKI